MSGMSIPDAIKNAELHHSQLSSEILLLPGMSSAKVRHLLNLLVASCNKYLEIGVWKGSTIISALYKNKPQEYFAIDNFSEFGGPKNEFIGNFQSALGHPPKLFDVDCFSVDPLSLGIKDIDMYFYDGSHEEHHQSLALTHFYDSLADEFVFIVDDYSWEKVAAGTQAGIKSANLQILEEFVLPSSKINDSEQWWNGLYVARLAKKKISSSIPIDLNSKYTMGGDVETRSWFFDDSKKVVAYDYEPHIIQNMREKIGRREQNYYGPTDTYLYEALEKFPIKGKSVLVFGSETPWYETMALEFGASRVTVSEYNPRSCPEPGTRYVKPSELGDEQFDCALSISSFEHDGLGRYGDPLNPYGDLLAMLQAKRNVIYGGLLFLAVPVGKDALIWNAHRVYGSLRLPLLLQNWSLISSHGFSDSDYNRQFGHITASSCHQPVFVLNNV